MKMVIIAIIAVLGIGYLALFPFSANGYGYAGYQGYHTGPSMFYMTGPRYYPNRSLRNASVRGPGTSSGMHYGK